jgi:hypothetical protein
MWVGGFGDDVGYEEIVCYLSYLVGISLFFYLPIHRIFHSISVFVFCWIIKGHALRTRECSIIKSLRTCGKRE